MRFLVPIRQISFGGPLGFSQLRATCREDASNTELKVITDPRELLLHPLAGMTRARLKFNGVAFQQLCSEMSGGLFSLLAGLESDMAGTLTQENAVGRQRQLIGIYNTVVKCVGGKLVGRRLVVDRRAVGTAEGVVVGAVGRHYRYVANADLLQAVASHVAGERNRYGMIKAELKNRDLFVLLGRRAASVTADGVVLRDGTAVYNSETTRRAIFLPNVLFDSETSSYSHATESSDNKLVHRKKKKFEQHLDAVVQVAFSADSILEQARGRVVEARRAELGNESNRELTLRKISGRLIERKVNAMPVERVISLLTRGGRISQWSLYAALLRAAVDYSSSERRLRMTAYRYLIESRL